MSEIYLNESKKSISSSDLKLLADFSMSLLYFFAHKNDVEFDESLQQLVHSQISILSPSVLFLRLIISFRSLKPTNGEVFTVQRKIANSKKYCWLKINYRST